MKKLILFIDSGDTIVDEATEVRDENQIVISAGFLPGAQETLSKIKESGYTVALVADGIPASFANIYHQHGMEDYFAARAMSGEVGVQKPDERMFRAAMERLNLSDCDIPRIVMVGNNIKRDVLGANRMGIRSVLIDWSPRYEYESDDPMTKPDHIIHQFSALFPLMEKLEKGL